MVEREEHSNDEWRYLGAPLGLRHPIPISPQEPRVTLTVGDKLIDFLIDTGATYSVVNTKVAQKTSQSITVTGVSGEVQNHSFLRPLDSCRLTCQNTSQCIQKRTRKGAKEWGFTLYHTLPAWKCSAQGIVLILEALLDTVLQHFHNSIHYGRDATL